MKVSVLASGSRGNSTFISTKNTSILIDTGISLRQIKMRLKTLSLDLSNLKAVLVTHEHGDHVKELLTILTRSNALLYCSFLCYQQLAWRIPDFPLKRVKFIQKDTCYTVGDLSFVPISLSHDSLEPFGYLVKDGDDSVAYLTDTGVLDNKYYSILSQMKMLIIESNHDEGMLQKSHRPPTLKQRIASTFGHLSNSQCASILSAVISEKTKYIVLAHLSEECNTPELAIKSAKTVVPSHIVLYPASYSEPTPCFDIREDEKIVA